MSTHSRIGIVNSEGIVKSIYCHYDGYTEHVGAMLVNHYNTKEKASELINLGSLSSLRERLAPEDNEGHSFEDAIEDVTVAYHRDRGEGFQQKTNYSVDGYFNNTQEEYIYLFTLEGEWVFKPRSRKGDPTLVREEL